MTYYRDLSPYGYSPNNIHGPALNVGWLARLRRVSRGSVPPELIDRLLEHHRFQVCSTRGFHDCPFCVGLCGDAPTTERVGDLVYSLGSAELRIFGADHTYAAPDLVIHYIRAHSYGPPSDFLEALRSGLQPGTTEYLQRLYENVSPETLKARQLKDRELLFEFSRSPNEDNRRVFREWMAEVFSAHYILGLADRDQPEAPMEFDAAGLRAVLRAKAPVEDGLWFMWLLKRVGLFSRSFGVGEIGVESRFHAS